VEVEEGAFGAAIDGEEIEGGAGHVFAHPQALGQALDEGGLADAEIAVQGQRRIGRQGGGEGAPPLLGFCRGLRADTLAKLIEKVHERPPGWRRGLPLAIAKYVGVSAISLEGTERLTRRRGAGRLPGGPTSVSAVKRR